MLIRIATLIVCQVAVIAVCLFIYDVGWANLALDMQIILPTIGSIAFGLTALLVLVSDEAIARMKHETTVRARSKSIAHRTRFH